MIEFDADDTDDDERTQASPICTVDGRESAVIELSRVYIHGTRVASESTTNASDVAAAAVDCSFRDVWNYCMQGFRPSFAHR